MTDIEKQAHAEIDRLMNLRTKEGREEAYEVYIKHWDVCEPSCSDCCGDWKVLCCKPKSDEEPWMTLTKTDDDNESVRLCCELCDKEQGHEPDYYSCPCVKNCGHDFCYECAKKIEDDPQGICAFCLKEAEDDSEEEDDGTPFGDYGYMEDYIKTLNKKDKEWLNNNWKFIAEKMTEVMEQCVRYRSD